MTAPGVPELRKVYIRFKDGMPELDCGFSPYHGFKTLGVEIVPYYWNGKGVDAGEAPKAPSESEALRGGAGGAQAPEPATVNEQPQSDIDGFDDLSDEVAVVGFTGDVEYAFKRMGLVMPQLSDYPDYLIPHLHRTITPSTLGAVREGRHGYPVFVKPQRRKVFTGFVYDTLAMNAVTVSDDTHVYVSEPVDFVNEHRVFVYHHKVIDARRYRGDWRTQDFDAGVIEHAVMFGKEHGAPCAYLLDYGRVGVGRGRGHTALVERNDAISFGGYGLPHVTYARMLSTRWHEMVREAKPLPKEGA